MKDYSVVIRKRSAVDHQKRGKDLPHFLSESGRKGFFLSFKSLDLDSDCRERLHYVVEGNLLHSSRMSAFESQEDLLCSIHIYKILYITLNDYIIKIKFISRRIKIDLPLRIACFLWSLFNSPCFSSGASSNVLIKNSPFADTVRCLLNESNRTFILGGRQFRSYRLTTYDQSQLY